MGNASPDEELRQGARVLRPDLVARAFAGRNLGEDWVVPKSSAAFLVIHPRAAGATLTAFDARGLIVHELFREDRAAFADLRRGLEESGATGPWSTIPPGSPALRHLLGPDSPSGDS